MDAAVDEAADTDRSSGGHAESAGVGEMDGEGEESLVSGGELEILRSSAMEGLLEELRAIAEKRNGYQASVPLRSKPKQT